MTLTPEDIAAGWVEWGGWHDGECPIREDLDAHVRYRDGDETDMFTTHPLAWRHDGDPHDIIAYRIVQPAAALEGDKHAL